MSQNEAQSQERRKKFRIEVDEHEAFPGIAKTAYVASNELCKLLSELFKSVFEDFEGCIFEAGNGGEPTISLLFNHGQYGQNATVACERSGAKESGNSVLDRTRNRDRQLAEGDRYYLTEDGKDVITTLLVPRAFNNGNPNWRGIVSEWQDRSVTNLYNANAAVQYTKVSYIDLKRVCSLVYGQKDENGDDIAYEVRMTAPLAPMGYQSNMNMNMNYMLHITSVSASEVSKVYEKLGFGSTGTHIIRG